MAEQTHTDADSDLPLGRSYWDRLPVELHDMIFEHVDILTQFLNGKLKNLDDKSNRLIWIDVFSTNWPGDLSLLPVPPNSGEHVIANADLSVVTSRDLYNRLCQRFPQATESNELFAEIDNSLKSTEAFEDHVENTPNFKDNINKLRLLNIPMHNMWLDLLGNMIAVCPYALAYHCIHRNHHDLLVHLVGTETIDVTKLQEFEFPLYPHSYRAMDFLAGSGYFDMLLMFHDADCRKITSNGIRLAAKNQHLDVFVWLYEMYPDIVPDNIVSYAVSGGKIPVLEWLYEHRFELFDDVNWVEPAWTGQLSVLKWYHEMRFDGLDADVMEYAAGYGHLHIVKWYHEMGFGGCTTDVMDWAAESGHLDVVKWLHENRSEGCTTEAMDDAAKNGHADIVRFLLENRTEGFSDAAVCDSKMPEITELLVESMDMNRRVSMLQTAREEEWKPFIIEALERNISN